MGKPTPSRGENTVEMGDGGDLHRLAAEMREALQWEQICSGSWLFAPSHVVSAESTGHAMTGPDPVGKAVDQPQVAPTGHASDVKTRVIPSLATLQEQAAGCRACRLGAGRTHSVFARGNPGARLVFVGEGPGYHEDQQGVPFVGRAGQLLDRMILAMELPVEEVYICNVVKCRPPENRAPLPDEVSACMPFLVGQLQHVAPKIIVALGKSAAEALIGKAPRGWRGSWGNWQGIQVMPTYHPAFLLRNPAMKRAVWQDLQAVNRVLAEAP